jgi:lipopolysaccharide/colanic/teichoic acid biosynthesis glycosyltransferase
VTLKRAIDLVIGVMAIIVTSPIALAAGAAIKLTSSGPVLHRATRVGKDGVPFTVLKLRTMRVGAANEGPGITTLRDPRITPIGMRLRRLKIDELPQLLNVLSGEMSLVGPRPEDPRYVERYTVDQRRVLTVRPGLTSPAALAYRDEERLIEAQAGDVEAAYLDRIMPAKLRLDLDYLDHRTMWLDIRVMLKTVTGVFSRPRRASE